MIIERIDRNEYDGLIKNYNANVYNESAFIELNSNKVDNIYYLVAKENMNPRFAVHFGIRDGCASMPFSAPNAIPVGLKKHMCIQNYNDFLLELEAYAMLERWKQIKLVLPPVVYNSQEIYAWINALSNNGYIMESADINYSMDLTMFSDGDYIKSLKPNARRNLKIANDAELEFYTCSNDTEKETAYDIIKKNRNMKGYPLKMSKDQVMMTNKIVDADMYIVKKDGRGIAAAMLYKVNKEVEQLIYWGDVESELRPINFAAYKLANIYKEKDYRYIDIGTASVDSVPNYGLCDFKESIGCERSIKYAFSKNISKNT